MRDGVDAGLFALDDSLWRGSIYSGEEGRNGAVAFDPHTISGGFAFAGVVPRFGGRGAIVATGAGEGGTLLHQHARGVASGAENFAAAAQRHEADRDDHRREAFGADTGRWAHLQECLWTGSAGGEPDAGRSFEVQAGGRADQYIYAGVGLWVGAVCAESYRDVPGEGVLHDAVHAG